MSKEYRLHSGARSANNVTGILCCVLIIGIPLGIWVFVRNAKARAVLSDSGVRASGLFSGTAFEYAEVARLGIVKVDVVSARGAAGALARAKVGGDHAVHLVVKTRSGKDRRFMVSAYENWQEIVDAIAARLGMVCETLEPHGAGGVYGARWP